MQQNLNPSEGSKDNHPDTPADMGSPQIRDPGYEVGYKKPPKETRFEKGQSGNPKRRTTRVKTHDRCLSDILDQTISITENGRPRKISKMEAMMKQIVNGAAKDDPKCIDALLRMMEYYYKPRPPRKKAASPPINSSVICIIPEGHEYPRDPEL